MPASNLKQQESEKRVGALSLGELVMVGMLVTSELEFFAYFLCLLCADKRLLVGEEPCPKPIQSQEHHQELLRGALWPNLSQVESK